MKKRTWLKTAAFTAAGLGAGYLFYRLFGCTSGCALNSNPAFPMLAGALLGLSFALPDKEKKGE